ncbi:hypothetical protein SODALDRAFT_71310 [Sodiomyces alkalinus F11]|uniref:Uncharacterized protein n=1 Tax=Sodiomyces alkalinus (strain CBS 110278 / VKM F-3762 / F11) TaxID=1314773 RepID=A0A3N2PMS1_SODAK|nr:hypothetical protein SODALDRAFT_71310 [Sodiomyces alkalinus F11]ROT35636.1 hypothetical protein SODALDRAFT_71310 [Sodiomyces alkalinus F11]
MGFPFFLRAGVDKEERLSALAMVGLVRVDVMWERGVKVEVGGQQLAVGHRSCPGIAGMVRLLARDNPRRLEGRLTVWCCRSRLNCPPRLTVANPSNPVGAVAKLVDIGLNLVLSIREDRDRLSTGDEFVRPNWSIELREFVSESCRDAILMIWRFKPPGKLERMCLFVFCIRG